MTDIRRSSLAIGSTTTTTRRTVRPSTVWRQSDDGYLICLDPGVAAEIADHALGEVKRLDI